MLGERINPQPKPHKREKERRYVPRSNAAGRRIAKAENACSKLAEKRADGLCEFCGEVGNQTQHGLGKQAHPEVRFDGRNLFWSCDPCHRRGERDREWLKLKMGLILGHGQYADLLVRALYGRMDDPREVLAAASAGRFLIEREAA